ncbi:MAG: hypothetical protein PWQ74_425 [Methanobacteriaceae archaeon]|nr:hypothetical protein [Methanobacteriaceae archaeon]
MCPMIIKAKIRLNYENNETARITFKALEPDNRGFIDGEILDNSIIFKLKGESIGSIRQTIDDLLVSEMIIENMVIR